MGAAVTAALYLAGCGSGSEQRVAPQPKLPASVAVALAARSDQVGRALAGRDSCRALRLARQLQQETLATINGGRVPGGFQEQLASTVGDLVSRIKCVPSNEGVQKNGKHDNGKEGKHEGKGKRKHEADD